jgi:predicted permease
MRVAERLARTVVRLSRRLISWSLSPEDRSLLGELDELYEERYRAGRACSAALWYLRQAGGFVARRLAGLLGQTPRPKGGIILDRLNGDIRYAARQLSRTPLSTLVAALSLGVGITVAVTAFTLLNSLVLKPLPVPDSERVVHVFSSGGGPHDSPYAGSAYADVEDYRTSGAFAGVVAWQTVRTTLMANQFAPARHEVSFVTPDFFNALGVRMASGRSYTDGDAFEIVLSERYRQRTFARGEQVLGATVDINGVQFTVVGVAPAAFRGLTRYDGSVAGWVPAPTISHVISGSRADRVDRSIRHWSVAARLAPGVAPEAAAARLASTARALAEQHPAEWRTLAGAARRMSVLTPRERALNDPLLGDIATLLTPVVAIILLLACTNVGGLLLARSITRRHEIAVRRALGASRARLTAQMLTESLVLAFLGGAFGLLGSQAAVRLMTSSAIFTSFDLSLDWRVLAVTTALCVLSALMFGITPIGQTLRVDVKAGLTGQGVVSERGGVRGRLIALQVCLSFLLVVLGVHASRGFLSRIHADPGFDLDGVVVANLDIAFPGADSVARRGYVEDAVRELRALPGVTRTALAHAVPSSSQGSTGGFVTALGGPIGVSVHRVDAEYFETIGMPLLAGAVPAWGGRTDDHRRIVVNRALAERIGGSVLGMTVEYDRDVVTVIGVVDDRVPGRPRHAAFPALYEIRSDWAQSGGVFLVARVTRGSESMVAAQFVSRMRALFPSRVPPVASSLREQLESVFAPQRYVATAAVAAGALQLLLAALGLYSLLLYATLARTREIGLRMALGAGPRSASMTVISEGLRYVLAGTMLGLALGIPAAIIAARQFAGADPTDPVPFAAAIAGILAAAAAAAFVPALRAARVQPMSALRIE